MDKFVCIHGHFYQPPRENPWLEEIEVQDSAFPYHDWNDRVTAECYGPNAASRILGHDMRIIEIVNNYSKISFDFGPTILSDIQRCNPDVYEAIIEADRESAKRYSGHGSAMAQAYNHMIMPLAGIRDKKTQVKWGITDFRRRFKRDPEGMWLPETAANTETLEVLAEHGIKFTVLSPWQAARVKSLKDAEWSETGDKRIDTTEAYLCRLPSGREIALFFYNQEISHAVGFAGLLNSGEEFAKRLVAPFLDRMQKPGMVHIATDGESYGHHHFHGEMALSYCLYLLESGKFVKLTNYGEYLSKHPPQQMVEIREDMSWSCFHGLERWRSDCGCNSGNRGSWSQGWRGPLREAMDWLSARLCAIYEQEASRLFKDPWEARDGYIEVILDRSKENVEIFLSKHAAMPLSKEMKVRALKLLEMQRNAMLMYTSCGWFFDEISGIETVQIMQYALRAMQLSEEIRPDEPLEEDYLRILERAPSNIYGNGRKVYELFVRPAKLDLLRVAGHYAISSLFQEYPGCTGIYCYRAENEVYEKLEVRRSKVALGIARIASNITWEEEKVCFAVLHMGDHNINGGVKAYSHENDYRHMADEINTVFSKGDIPQVIRLIDRNFGAAVYSLWHLFKDEQRRALDQIFTTTYNEIEDSYRRIYDENSIIMDFLRSLNIPPHSSLSVTARFVINMELKKSFNDHVQVAKLGALIRKSKEWGIEIEPEPIGYMAGAWVNSAMESVSKNPFELELLKKVRDVLKLLGPFNLKMNLWKAQNIYYSMSKGFYQKTKELADKGDRVSRAWVETFDSLGDFLHVKVS